MATTKATTTTDEGAITELSHEVHAIAAQLSGMEATLRIFNEAESNGSLGDALYLLAKSCARMNDDLCRIAGQITKGGAA